MRPNIRWFPLLAAIVVLSGQTPARADCLQVHLVVRMTNPVLNDFLQLTYAVTVTNLGPGRATGLAVRRVARLCRTADPAACAAPPAADYRVADLASGREARFLAVVPLLFTEPQAVRTTVEVVHVDQQDVASAPGTCAGGARRQDDCATVVTVLR